MATLAVGDEDESPPCGRLREPNSPHLDARVALPEPEPELLRWWRAEASGSSPLTVVCLPEPGEHAPDGLWLGGYLDPLQVPAAKTASADVDLPHVA